MASTTTSATKDGSTMPSVAAVGQLLGSHGRVHALGAEDRHADAVVAVRDGEVLGQLDAGGLGHRVGGGSDRQQQAGGGGGLQEVALAPRQHAGQHGPGRVHVGHHVQVPLLLPGVVAGLDAAVRARPGVGEEHVDGAVAFLDLVDEAAAAPPRRSRRGRRPSPRPRRCRPGSPRPRRRLGVAIDEHHRPGALLGEAASDGAADASAPAGDDRDPALQLHRRDRSGSPSAEQRSQRVWP